MGFLDYTCEMVQQNLDANIKAEKVMQSRLETILVNMEQTLKVLKGYNGWIIGKCELCLEGGLREMNPEDYSLNILKQGRTLVLTEIRGPNEEKKEYLRVLLVKPFHLKTNGKEERNAVFNKKGEICETNSISEREFCISAAEASHFLEKVSDYNSIHQGEQAILPGFLIMNEILKVLLHLKIICEDRFYANTKFILPLRPQEQAVLKIGPEKNGKREITLDLPNSMVALRMEIRTDVQDKGSFIS